MAETTPSASDAVAAVHRAAMSVARQNSNAWIRSQAEDIAQETVVSFLAHGPERIESPRAWARHTAANEIVNRMRADARGRPADGYNPNSLHDADHHVHGDDGTQAIHEFLRQTNVLSTSEQVNIRWAIEMVQTLLTPREVELVTRTAAGQSQAAIAIAMGYKDASSVKTTAARIRRKVETAIGGQDARGDYLGHQRGY
jgi:DNA-directed RNA polymerase specialized sigma24 family protein